MAIPPVQEESMDIETDRLLVQAAIFIDLENLGVIGRTEHGRRRLKWVLHGLRESLPRHSIRMGPVWGAVRVTIGQHTPIGVHRDALTKLMRGHNGKISWGHEIADSQIIQEIERQLESGQLHDVVILITSDGDFAPLVEKLREARRRVLVVYPGPNVSEMLAEAADVAMSLTEFIGKPVPPRPR